MTQIIHQEVWTQISKRVHRPTQRPIQDHYPRVHERKEHQTIPSRMVKPKTTPADSGWDANHRIVLLFNNTTGWKS